MTETSGTASAVRFARMAGSSIAGVDAAPWVTDPLLLFEHEGRTWVRAAGTWVGG